MSSSSEEDTPITDSESSGEEEKVVERKKKKRPQPTPARRKSKKAKRVEKEESSSSSSSSEDEKPAKKRTKKESGHGKKTKKQHSHHRSDGRHDDKKKKEKRPPSEFLLLSGEVGTKIKSAAVPGFPDETPARPVSASTKKKTPANATPAPRRTTFAVTVNTKISGAVWWLGGKVRADSLKCTDVFLDICKYLNEHKASGKIPADIYKTHSGFASLIIAVMYYIKAVKAKEVKDVKADEIDGYLTGFLAECKTAIPIIEEYKAKMMIKSKSTPATIPAPETTVAPMPPQDLPTATTTVTATVVI